MIQADSISKCFRTGHEELLVLRDVSLAIRRGESLAIMGPSGSGKSTLLNILGTLEPPTSGRVTFDGTDPFTLPESELARFRNTHVGFVFQEHHLLPQLSVLENVLLPTWAGRIANNATDRARRLLDRVGLSARLDHRPAELSGGERQRVAAARALINQPPVLLADEPTGNLDRANAESLADLLAELQREHQLAMVVVTHSRNLADRSDMTYVLRDGALLGE